MLKRGVILAVVYGLLSWPLGLGALPAMADKKCAKKDPATAQCLIWINIPSPSDPPSPKDPEKPTIPTGPATKCKLGDSTIPCKTKKGVWSAKYQCYLLRMSNPPAKSDPLWKGHKDGALYWCTYPDDSDSSVVWLPSAPDLPPPDPRQLALRAVAAMDLRAIEIGIVPEDKPGRVGVIGLPSWMWVADRGPSTWGPITRSASERGFSVSATARVDRMVWSMGDGSTVVCRKPGTAYADRFGQRPSPDCGHTYTRQGRYTVRATSYWVVTWAGLGKTGTIRFDLTQDTQIVMGEVQVLTQGR